MRKSFALAAILVSFMTGNAFALGQARFIGKIMDPNKNPIPDATVTVSTSEGKNFKQVFKSDKKGQVTFILMDGTVRYKVVYAKDGFAPYEETVKFKLLPESNERTITLSPGSAAGATTTTTSVPMAAKPDPGVTAYNEGAVLANAGNTDAAIAKFEEAVTAQPTLIAGYVALTKMYTLKKNWAKVIENGNKVLAVDTDNPDIALLVSQAYDKAGNKVKAAELRKKAPADPTSLFNDAARSINAGKDKEAEALLTQALTADDNFAAAHYELGMIYARAGKNSDARKHLQKYLELDPKGKDAATAKEMLKYVK